MVNQISKCAIITGIYGQDGSLLAEHLLDLGYRVIGLVTKHKEGFRNLAAAEIFETDICNPDAMNAIFSNERPQECYHLAAYHHPSDKQSSTECRWQMLRINFMSTQVILDALLEHVPRCRFLYAGSSQMYTPKEDVTVINETTAVVPSTYYGITKAACLQLIKLLRNERDLWGVNAILFNHESTRRSSQFLSRKVTSSAAAFSISGSTAMPKLQLRDLAARTDWSAASDIVRAMHRALQAKNPQDYVLASGSVHTVEDLVKEAFALVNLDWREYVDASCLETTTKRPCLQGDAERAKRELGWRAEKSFSQLIREMVQYDLSLATVIAT